MLECISDNSLACFQQIATKNGSKFYLKQVFLPYRITLVIFIFPYFNLVTIATSVNFLIDVYILNTAILL